jgi:predicted PurR-regulated permease PerM
MAASDSSVTRNATVVLAVIASGAAMLWMADILAPLAMAVFLAVMIDGFARVMEDRIPGFPKPLALPAAICLSLLLFGVSALVIADNAAGFVGQAQAYGPRLDAMLAKLAAAVHAKPPMPLADMVREFQPSKNLSGVGRVLQSAGSTLGFWSFVLIYLGFIIASRRLFRRKIVALFPHHAGREKAALVFQRIRDGVESYLWIQTVTGLMIAVASWAVMALIGLDNAFFWAFLIFIVCYVPIIGGAVAVLAPPLFALVQFDSYWPAVILISALNAITFVVGNIVLPRMQSDTLNMDPVVVLLSLAFWGAIWGVPGMFLSTPLTVIAMVVCAQFDGARWVAVLLSADGEPDKLRNRKIPSSPDEKPARIRGAASRKRENP